MLSGLSFGRETREPWKGRRLQGIMTIVRDTECGSFKRALLG